MLHAAIPFNWLSNFTGAYAFSIQSHSIETSSSLFVWWIQAHKIDVPYAALCVIKARDGFLYYDVIKCKHFPRYWPFVRGIHRSPVNSPHKGRWWGALMLSLICAGINAWVNNREAGDSRRHRAQYDVTVTMGVGIVNEICIKSICFSVKWSHHFTILHISQHLRCRVRICVTKSYSIRIEFPWF